MKKPGRNDPCPCGSGKKFKKCHQDKEDDLLLDGVDGVSLEEMGAKITKLTPVDYGRSSSLSVLSLLAGFYVRRDFLAGALRRPHCEP